MTADLITEPGIYPHITAEEYHADPVAGGSLSSSAARALLPPSCPAKYRYATDHGTAPRRHYDLGHAAHRLVLGHGAEIEVIDAADWRTQAAKTAAIVARADGRTPLLAHEYAIVVAMAEALQAHPVARWLFDPARGVPEQTLVWRDPATEVWCRARLDWLPNPAAGRLIIPDYKTCASADTEALRRTMAQFGYHQQAAWYLEACRAVLGAGPDAAFIFVAQEKTAPYTVTVFEPDSTALRIADARNARARQLYRHCTATGEWPGYTENVALLALPRWAEIEEGE